MRGIASVANIRRNALHSPILPLTTLVATPVINRNP
jgi:hypothetical protein